MEREIERRRVSGAAGMSGLGKFCEACQAIPAAGFCLLADCPTGPRPYTPGPWTYATEYTDSPDVFGPYLEVRATTRSPAVGEIAMVLCCDTYAEGLANARLIAAAPDLLAAAQGAFDNLELLWPLAEIEDDAVAMIAVGKLKRLKAAIAKAEGQQ